MKCFNSFTLIFNRKIYLSCYMILALDVHYKETYAKSVGVLFNWQDSSPAKIITAIIDDVSAYIPGQFYKRELPCLLPVINQVDKDIIEAIITDSYVYIDNNKNFGLGGYLWKVLDEKIAVIGVGKTAFHTNRQTVMEVFRGVSKNPLYVSAIGIDNNEAAQLVKNMHGEYRMPSLLKTLDQITKQI